MTRLVFLQLPRPEPDARAPCENVPLAAMYLHAALRRYGPSRAIRCVLPDPAWDGLDNASLLQILDAWRPDAVACTLYCWNVERTLRLVRELRRRHPRLVTVAGGPEVAEDHPFLFRARVFDALVQGEGEGVFPAVVESLLSGAGRVACPAWESVFWKTSGAYQGGALPPPRADLAKTLPRATACAGMPDATGLVLLETIRGCPMRCTYCRYNQSRVGVDILPAEAVLRRMRAFLRCGARDFRFVDPTMNARPDFDMLLAGMARLRRRQAFRCFAEVNAATLTASQIHLLPQAGIAEVEAGVQCRAAPVRAAIRRGEDLARTERNLLLLRDAGVGVSVDLMYGLPRQTAEHFREDFLWTRSLRGVRVQYFQTLLLPGTRLAAEADAWGIRALCKPPYGVQSTGTLSGRALRELPAWCEEETGLAMETATRRFVGKRLPDLFAERVAVSLDALPQTLPPGAARRAVLVSGKGFHAHRDGLAAWLGRVVCRDPDTLWQFVLCFDGEEPLDVLDTLIAAVRRMPPHLLDRTAQTRLRGLLVSRRIFVRLSARAAWSPDWIAAAEETLAEAFL